MVNVVLDARKKTLRADRQQFQRFLATAPRSAAVRQ